MSVDPTEPAAHEPVAHELATHIATVLKEPNTELIQSIIEQLGEERARSLLEETQRIEAEGGQLIKSGKRRRTPGGVFINLARQQLTKEQKKIVFAEPGWRHVWMGPGAPPKGLPLELRKKKKHKAVVTEKWDVVHKAVKQLLEAKEIGKATEVKIQLTGRPGKVAVRKHFVVTTIETHAEPPELREGMPTPPKARLVYLVYIARKEWGPISHQLQHHPDDEMLIDGFLTYDSELKKLSIFATKATTRLLEERAALVSTDSVDELADEVEAEAETEEAETEAEVAAE